MRPIDFYGEFRCAGHYYRMFEGQILQKDKLKDSDNSNNDDDDEEIFDEQTLQLTKEVSNEPVFDNLGIVAIIATIIYLILSFLIVTISMAIRNATKDYAKFMYIRKYGSQIKTFAMLDIDIDRW